MNANVDDEEEIENTENSAVASDNKIIQNKTSNEAIPKTSKFKIYKIFKQKKIFFSFSFTFSSHERNKKSTAINRKQSRNISL